MAGAYRPADADEVLLAGQRVLAGRVRGSNELRYAVLRTVSGRLLI